MKNKEMNFLFKVIRNGMILSGLYFVSVWGTATDLNMAICKPIILFLFFYVLTDLSKRYGLDAKNVKSKNFKCGATLIL